MGYQNFLEKSSAIKYLNQISCVYPDVCVVSCVFITLENCFRKYIEVITRWREDMNFMFECQEQYLLANVLFII